MESGDLGKFPNMEAVKEMKSPIQEQQKKEEERLDICYDIIKNSRNELYVSMRFLDVALASLRPEPAFGTGTVGTDGEALYFEPDWMLQTFLQRKVLINRLYLHELFH